jgi:hypothetical protein
MLRRKELRKNLDDEQKKMFHMGLIRQMLLRLTTTLLLRFCRIFHLCHGNQEGSDRELPSMHVTN